VKAEDLSPEFERSPVPVQSLTKRWAEKPADPVIPRGDVRPTMKSIERAIESGRRLTREEGLYLVTDAPLATLGALAQEVRTRRHPEGRVTYVIDSNPNYTNVCTVDCLFCAFYRKPGHDEAYTLSIEDVCSHIERASAAGVTTVLLQGGLNPRIPFSFYPDLVREVRRRFPHVTPHFFSAPEVLQMAEVSGLTVKGVLQALQAAGQFSIPGGGAEILSDRVRRRIGPKKGSVERWLEVHRAAHEIGMRSTATMMYGHYDAPEDRLEHLDLVRELQDESLGKGQKGFTAFVPWSYKRDNSALANKIKRNAGAPLYLRMLAAARLYLDNFDHVQASWFSEGKRAGQVALHYGADDFGGTLFEENVHKATGHLVSTTTEEAKLLIREAGFIPAQRTTLYEILKVDDEAPANPTTVSGVSASAHASSE
jgi:dehypoxanthine futalosine cyclase